MKTSYAQTFSQAIKPQKTAVQATRQLFRDSLIHALAVTRKKRSKQFLRCLYCHYVFDDQVELFESAIKALANSGSFVDTSSCLEMLEGARSIDDSYYHLSFDDGFRNVYQNALPILKAKNIPALLFIPTALIDSDIEESRKFCVENANYAAPIEFMRWEEVQVAANSGFEIGSHTQSHSRLVTISNNVELMMQEVNESKIIIERRLGVECSYFSWPYGRGEDIDENAISFIKDAEYRACFGAFRGSIRPGKTSPYMIPRHHFEPNWPLRHIKFFANGNMELKA